MSGFSVLKTLEKDATSEFEHWHGRLVLAQFASGYAAALVVSLAAAGWHVAGWAALWSLLGGAGLAAGEKLWPSVPWSALLAVIHDAQAVAAPPKPPLPAPISTPTLKAPDK